MNLAFGYNAGVPEDVHTAWGARLIAPNDLVHDRQDLVAENDEAKRELMDWLNGNEYHTGAVRQALQNLRQLRPQDRVSDGEEFVVFADHRGEIVGNTQQSGGYIYVAGWLFSDDTDLD